MILTCARLAGTMRRPMNKCQSASILLAMVVISMAAQPTSCKPQQQQQQQQQQQVDKHRDRKQQQQIDEQANHLSRTSPSSLSSTTATISLSESSSQLFQCPEQFGYYVDQRDCSKYYVCVFGEVLHESCTGGLRFSRELQTCDWPRNVQCPSSTSANAATSPTSTTSPNFGSTSAATTAPSAASTPTTTTTTSTTTTTAATSTTTTPGSPGHQEQPHNGRPLKNAAAMVFADEGSDPQQPSFDEAVSPVITPDGAIHLHDGSGGTFSLQAQPNQHHSQAAAGGNSAPTGGVDVFVKPLLAANSNQARPRQAATSSLQQQQQQQQQIKPAALLQASQNHQHQSRNNQFNPSSSSTSASSSNEDNQPSSDISSDEELDDEGNNNNSNSNSNSDSNSNSNNSDGSSSSSEAAASNDDDSSISAQADQELANEQQAARDSADQVLNSSASDQTDLPSSFSAAAAGQQQQQQRQLQQQSGAGYIPPVVASGAAPNLARQAAAQASRQSSQLLSVNNRQVDARNSFRPILVSSSGPKQPAQLTTNTRGAGGGLFAGPIESSSHNDNNNSDDDQTGPAEADDADGGDSLPAQPLPAARQEQLNSNRQLLALSNSAAARSSGQQQARFRQLPINLNTNQALMRHNQSSFTTAPNFKSNTNNNNNFIQLNQNNNNLLAQQQQQQQNNRQSRMSMQNQLQQTNGNNNDNFQTNFQPTNRLLQQQQQQQQPFNNNQQQQHGSNNFMNESKLIRSQQASQFEPSSPPVDLQTTTAAALAPLNSNGNGNGFHHQPHHSQNAKQFSPNSQQQFISPSQRSQNVLFSQQPFGLIADHQSNNLNQNQRLQLLAEPALANQQQQPSLLQQQRRPRPPKRQQIPVGQSSSAGRRNPAAAQLPGGTTSRNQLFPEPELMTSRPPASSTTTMASFQPTPNTLANGFLAATEAAAGGPIGSFPLFGGDADSDEEPGAELGTSVVPPTTSRFQTQPTRSRGPAEATGTTFGAPVVTTELAPTTMGRGFGGPAHDSAVGQPRTGQGQQRQAKLLSAADLPPPPRLAANGLPAAPGQLQTNSNPNPASHHPNPTSSTTVATTTTTASSGGRASGNSNQQEQDPQLVANRYLNSAMEAGQPFGAVDYDFEILNDNSTDRRHPPASNGTGAGTVDRQRPANNNLNTLKQRQQPADGSPTGVTVELPTTDSRPGESSDDTVEGDTIEPTSLGSANGGDAPTGGQRSQAATSGNGRPLRGGTGSAQRQAGSIVAPALQVGSAAAPAPQTTTKKPRPTNRKIQVNHEQALANNRASIEPAKRPDNLFATPNPLQTASKCDTRHCRLPDCKCGDTLIPGALEAKQVPQVVLLTFDDAVNDLNWEIYEELFTGRTNPNGCPILATFYVSHEWTDYGQVQTLYSRGHEMASHSITHSFGEKFSKHQWFKEVNGQREILNLYGGVKMNDVRGMRAPFLQIGGNKMFEMLYDANFTYDSSMPIFENLPPLWPYTLDYQLAHECMITPCPTKSFPGVWEVGMTMWVDLRGGRCSMGDACSNPSDEDGVYEMLMKNFNRHYKSNRAPFGLFYHSAWFNTVHHRRGFLKFLSQVNSMPDVFFTTNWQMLQWMRNPTPLSEINQFEPWQCPAKNDRPPPCYHPSVCNVKSEHGTRFMKTCQPCPANQQYPWVGV